MFQVAALAPMAPRSTDREELVRAAFAAFNRRDVDAVCAHVHDGLDVIPVPGFAPPGTSFHGRAGLRSLLAELESRFDGLRITPSLIRDTGGFVLALLTITADGRGDSGAIEHEAAVLLAVEDGRISRALGYSTEAEALEAAKRERPPGVRAPKLTPREREVFQLLALGYTGREIADRLVLSPDTVRTHVQNGIGRLGAKTRGQGIAIALSRGDITL
jgi:DNA-binding NarL/FixJ family response regulator